MAEAKTLIEDLKKARQEFLDEVEKFPKDKVDETLFDKWTIKEILGHMSAWELWAVEQTKSMKGTGKVKDWIISEDEFNGQEVLKRKNWDFDRIFLELKTAGEEDLKTYESLPDDVWDKSCGPDGTYSLREFIKEDISHYKNHLAQIRLTLDSLIAIE